MSILKDKIPSFLRSGIVYKFQSGCWNAICYGKTKRHFNVRVCDDLGICGLTGKGVKDDDDSDIKEHLLLYHQAKHSFPYLDLIKMFSYDLVMYIYVKHI